jgi:hypothetical protein
VSIPWEKVLTDPLGLAGFALFLIFGAVTVVIKQRKPTNRWVVSAGVALAALSVLGGLTLAFLRKPLMPVTPPNPTAPTNSMQVDKVEQKVGSGNAVAGVQGNVTVTAPSAPTSPKAKP